MKNLGWISRIKGVAAGMANYLEMEARGPTPQVPCMMQLPHAYSVTLGKCTRCAQEGIVRK
eukprot:16430974-Heterocapsa_arctica.AAC.1